MDLDLRIFSRAASLGALAPPAPMTLPAATLLTPGPLCCKAVFSRRADGRALARRWLGSCGPLGMLDPAVDKLSALLKPVDRFEVGLLPPPKAFLLLAAKSSVLDRAAGESLAARAFSTAFRTISRACWIIERSSSPVSNRISTFVSPSVVAPWLRLVLADHGLD